jgi:hypothetical protein
LRVRPYLHLAAAGLLGLALPATRAESPSTFFSTVWVDDAATYAAPRSDGDLWPSAWGPDGALYAANGDGAGFTRIPGATDIVVSRITGGPDSLQGVSLASGDQVGSIWSGDDYNRKPTGMVCADGVLYLAVQDLNRHDFDDAPAASVSRSNDLGRTWTWDRSAPMFKDHVFTTIFFLDYGKDSANAPDGYVYAYGMDNNWRDAFSGKVPDPTDLYLGRVPRASVQDRAAWEFFAGMLPAGEPKWSRDIADRKPVLTTTERVYPKIHGTTNMRNMSVISQGNVVYNKPLRRYIYTSWTEYTLEFFESPSPWGPWKPFYRKDFGMYPWMPEKFGGYGATIPSRFISADGRTMYVQDNTFNSGVRNYRFSLRKMRVEPWKASRPENRPDPRLNLARKGKGVVPIAKSFGTARSGRLNDGQTTASEDDWDKEDKPLSWWGYTWPRRYTMDTVVFTSGEVRDEGGWFRETPRVQVRRNGEWADVKGQSVSPAYPAARPEKPYRRYVFRFQPTDADGIRLIGAPGGAQTFTTVAELEVFYAG